MQEDYIPGTSLKIHQSDDVFKFGIDSILLSSFSKMKKNTYLMDIGCGSGILALRAYGLYDLSKVFAVEVQKRACNLAEKSVLANGLEDRIEIINQDLNKLDFKRESLDYIITNPPYVEKGRGLKNNKEAINIAFSEELLTLEDIFLFAKKTLKFKASLFMINRANRLVDILSLARKHKLEPVKIRMVHSYLESPAKLVMVELVKLGGKNLNIEKALVIYNKDGTYTEEIKEIYNGR